MHAIVTHKPRYFDDPLTHWWNLIPVHKFVLMYGDAAMSATFLHKDGVQ